MENNKNLIKIYRTFLATDDGNVSGIDNVKRKLSIILFFLSFSLLLVDTVVEE
jgi:hypothetical protein